MRLRQTGFLVRRLGKSLRSETLMMEMRIELSEIGNRKELFLSYTPTGDRIS